MSRYGLREKPVYRPAVLARTVVLKLRVRAITGKHKPPAVPPSVRM
jgi:hypothetical protein